MNISNCMQKAVFLLLLTAHIAHGGQSAEQTLDGIQPSQTIQQTEDFEQALANIPQDKLEEIKTMLAKVMDELVTKIIRQISSIEALLEDLSLQLNSEVIGGKNKDKLLKQIRSIRAVIDNVQSESFVEVDPRTLQFLVTFNELLIEHISESVQNGFKDLPSLHKRLATLQKRVPPMDLEAIEQRIEKNKKAIAQLSFDAQKIGLTWYNKAFRRVSHIFAIAHRRKWDSKIFVGGAMSFLATHWIFLNTSLGYDDIELVEDSMLRGKLKAAKGNIHGWNDAVEDCRKEIVDLAAKYSVDAMDLKKTRASGIAIWKAFANKINEIREAAARNPQGVGVLSRFTRALRGLFGHRVIADHDMQKIVNKDKVGTLGKLDFHVRQISSTLHSLYVPMFVLLLGKNWGRDFSKWINKSIASVSGRLLGGVPAQQAKKAQKEDGMEPKYTFDDVVGFDHIKEILRNILEYIKNPERFDRANIPPERGYLFTGLPGTGKSFVAEAFGGEIRKIFKSIGRSEDELGFYQFDADFINEKGIGWLLNLAKKESPCVIFIDEIDLLRLQRGGGNSELLSEFLGSMSGVLSKEDGKQVILLAATNRPEHLDKALRRRGRFGKIIHFELPTVAERKAFFVKKLSPLLPDLSKINIDKLAQETEGRTYEELTAMTNTAFQKAKILGQALTQKHLEDSLDEEIHNIINKKMNISESEQQLIASHQSGHALATELLNPRRELAGVTIKPITVKLKDESAYAQYYGERKQKDIRYGKTFTKCSFDYLGILTREEKINKCKILLAGMIAERILLGSCGHSYHANDKQQALDLIKSLVFEGMHVKTMPKKIQLDYFERALALLKQCEQEIEQLLRQHEDPLREIAHDLQKYKTLSARKVKKILASYGSSEHIEEAANAVVAS